MEPRFVNELLSWTLAVPVIAILVWVVVTALLALRRRRPSARVPLAKAGLVLVATATGSLVAFGFGFLARFNAMAMIDPTPLVYGLPPRLGRLLFLPWVIAASAIVLSVIAVASWQRRRGVRLLDRMLFTVTGICAIIFVVMLMQFSLLPPMA
jgi:hypothetical protein